MPRISIRFLLLGLLVAALLAGCTGVAPAPAGAPSADTAPEAASQDAVTITYYTFSASPDHMEDLGQMVAAFEAANPNIKVKVETAPFDDYFTKLQTLIAGGTAPDAFELNYENFVSYASKGVLLDMTPLVDADPGFADRFYPLAYQAFSRDGKQYGLPQSFSNVVLFYNKDLFDAAGVDYPKPEWTWQEELAAAQKLTDAANGVWGEYSPIQFWEFYKTAAQNGCSVLSADGKTSTINEPACVEALTWMVDKINNYKISPTDADMAGVSDGDMFKQGNLAMLRTGIWMFDGFKDAPFTWDIALEPGNTQKAHHFFSNGVAISATTPHPEEAAAWAKFFTSSPEAAQIRVAASWELPALNDQALFDEWLAIDPPASREVVFQALDTLVTPPVIEKQSQMQDAVNLVLEKVKSGEMAPQEALDQAKTEIDALLQ
jgi:multiple sugar transport system substrate-binding protein